MFERLEACRHKHRNRSVAECSREAVLHGHNSQPKTGTDPNGCYRRDPNPDRDSENSPFVLTFGWIP